MSAAPLLRVTDLQVEFPLSRGVLRAVDHATFEVGRGEALGLVGESGSGKTIALRALVGLLPRSARVTGGTIELAGADVTRLPDDVLDVRAPVVTRRRVAVSPDALFD